MIMENTEQSKTNKELQDENLELKSRLNEAEETLQAIQNGEIDAIVTPNGFEGPQVYTLESADYLYRILVEEMSEGVATLTNDGTIFYSNAKLASMLQIPLEKMAGKKLINFIFEHDKKTYESLRDKGLKAKSSSEIRIKSTDGEIIPVYISINSLKDLKGLYIVITDLSEQKHHEQLKIVYNQLNNSLKAAKSSENKYRSILNNLQDAYIQTDKEGKITIASPSAARMYHCNSPGQMIGISIAKFYKKSEDREFILEELKKHDKLENNESEALRKDGTCFYASQNAKYHYNDKGQIMGTETLVRDITDNKLAHEALKRSKLQFQVLIQNLNIGVVLVDDKGMLAVVNPTFMRMFGLDSDLDILNINNQDWSLWKVYDEDNKQLNFDEHPVMKVAITGKPVKNQLISVQNPGSNKLIWMLVSADPISNKDGTINKIICTYYDYTERKLDEERNQELLKNKVQLTDELKISNKELMETQDELMDTIKQLEISNKELKNFAYVTSHDLREPLRMITSFLQLLERRYYDQLDQDANDFIGYAVDGAKRLDLMINDILIYSKVSKGRKLSEVDINNVIKKVYINLISSIEETDTEITYDSLPTLITDESLMIQLFQNLIANSIKYRGKEKPKIHISAKKEGNKHIFSVKDNGIGIDQKYVKKIYTIFKRLHTSEEYDGTGIGLAIVQKIVQQFGGEIWVESEVGKGSTFYFTIPENNLSLLN
ncbi:PAS domain-containing sensor histidine kinase [Methanobacterium sp.]|uniref:PAS domain-containing sensor histidine kinase n=1 Tax=Methanobacterium sp. TaxID=2164 RepID=UPI003C775AA9